MGLEGGGGAREKKVEHVAHQGAAYRAILVGLPC